jgi:hypothetical protein
MRNHSLRVAAKQFEDERKAEDERKYFAKLEQLGLVVSLKTHEDSLRSTKSALLKSLDSYISLTSNSSMQVPIDHDSSCGNAFQVSLYGSAGCQKLDFFSY